MIMGILRALKGGQRSKQKHQSLHYTTSAGNGNRGAQRLQ